jgi:hypothetical protein
LDRLTLLLSYSFQAVKKNWKAVLLFFVFLVIFTFLSLVPFISPVANIALQIIGFQLMVYYGRPVLKRLSREELYAFLDSSTVKRIYTEKIEVSSGIFLASFIIGVLFVVFFFALLFVSGIPVGLEALEEAASEELIGSYLIRFLIVFVIFSLVAGWFLFVYPIALGYAMGRDDFGEAFLAIFRLFSPSFWKRALSFKYFIFITVSAIVSIFFSLLAVFSLFTLILFPLGVALVYMLNVFFGAVCAESYVMTGGEEELPSRSEVIDESQSQS